MDASRQGRPEGVGPLHEDDELVAAQPGQQIALARAGLHPLGGSLQGVVADGMAVGVIDVLEVVEVGDQDRQGLVAIPAIPAKRSVKARRLGRPVSVSASDCSSV